MDTPAVVIASSEKTVSEQMSKQIKLVTFCYAFYFPLNVMVYFELEQQKVKIV